MKKNILTEITITYSSSKPKKDRRKIQSSKDAYSLLNEYWDRNLIELQEEFNVLYLNRANEVLGVYNASKGGTSGTLVDVKLIFGVALKSNTHGIILSHNHPSGTLEPSSTDISITKKLKQAGEILNIAVLDHLIVSAEGFYSFADEGLI